MNCRRSMAVLTQEKQGRRNRFPPKYFGQEWTNGRLLYRYSLYLEPAATFLLRPGKLLRQLISYRPPHANTEMCHIFIRMMNLIAPDRVNRECSGKMCS